MAGTSDLANLSAAELGRRVTAGALDPVHLAESFLERIEGYPDQTVFLTMTVERALREAEASATRHRAGRPLGPLDGVPTVWKDILDVADTVTTAGSDLFRDNPAAGADAVVVANADRAGMISLGKTTLPEFAFSGLGQNPHFGTPHNPSDPSRMTGGSSSGTAAAIAAGLAPCGLGTDTGGSIRIPASFCGIVGFKTTARRIDKTGVIPLSHTLDTLGPLARTVEDCLLLDAVYRGVSPSAVAPPPIADVTVLAPPLTSIVIAQGDDAVVANFESALETLARSGARIERRPFEMFDAVHALTAKHGTILAAESYYQHKDRVDGADAARIDRRVMARIRRGTEMSACDLVAIEAERERLIADFEQALAGGCFVAMPTTLITAPEIAAIEADDTLFHETNLRALHNTMIGNFLRTCGLALPSGRDRGGLPTSILFTGPAGADEALLRAGLAIQPALAGA